MKIIISPSKTKKINKLKNINNSKNIIFSDITNKIVNEISEMELENIQKIFKLNEKKSKELLEFYKNFENENSGCAISTYTGIAFKSIDIESFNLEELQFLEEKLIILSALYGILTPFTNIKEYRLDMVNSIFKDTSLYKIWKDEINKYLKNEDYIINLASKEYSKIIDSEKLYDLEFYDEKEGKLKQISTNSKKMRGYTVNYIVKNKITKIENLKNISLLDYKFCEEMSNNKKYVYIKKEEK